MTEENTSSPSVTRIRPRTLVLAISGLLAILVTMFFVAYYRYTDSWFGHFVGERLPFPVVMLENDIIVESRVLAENVTSIKRFYESQDFGQVGIRVDFSTDEGKQRLKLRERDLLNKMLEDAVVKQLAQEAGIVITGEQARQDVDKRLQEYGSADKVETSIARLYGWTMRDFEEKVVLPSLYEEALAKKFEGEITNEKAKATIEAADKELKHNALFKAVVEKYSDGRTKTDGGDLGWFTLEDLAPELRSPVDVAKIGVPTNVIESSLGYHIILVEEVKNEDGKRLHHLRQVFVRKENFPDWLMEQIREHRVRVLLPDYQFDQGTGRIDFRSQAMKDFEAKLIANPDHDPLFFY